LNRRTLHPALSILAAIALCAPSAVFPALSFGQLARPIAGPARISSDGTWVLTADFAATPSAGIDIDADEVTLDLAGHTISGGGSGVLVRFLRSSEHGAVIRVRNGTLSGGAYGILLDASRVASARFEIEGVLVTGQASYGIYLLDSASAAAGHSTAMVSGNSVESVAGAGITLREIGAGSVDRNEIASSVNGIVVDGAGATPGSGTLSIQGNTLTGNGTGITAAFADTVVLAGNLVEKSRGSGIFLYRVNSATVDSNRCLANGGSGIRLALSTGNQVRSNVAEGNAGCGIEYSGGNALLDNRLDDNAAGDLCER
jgi:parallel beta-helix repeat protein